MFFNNSKWLMHVALGGTALAASLVTGVLPACAKAYDATDAKGIETFYAGRNLTWFSGSSPAPAANVLRSILVRAKAEGIADAEMLVVQVDRALADVRANPQATPQADRALSDAWIRYVRALNTPDPEFDNAAALPPVPASAILTSTAAAPSLVHYLLAMSAANPIYSQLRDAVWNDVQRTGNPPSQRVLANLRRARFKPPRDKYIIVDAASAQLFMFNRGQLVDSMRVIVGRKDTQTPLVASTIYSVTVNPYWNVPKDLAQRLIAPRVLARGTRYIKENRYEVVSAFGRDAVAVSPAEVDWKAVAGGTSGILVRQLPGPTNSMGKMKVWFPNGSDIFFHDTPEKTRFTSATRTLSNGCIRLEDAERFGRWLLEADALPTSSAPDHEVRLPQPVPVYVTYLTMRDDAGRLSFIADVYGKDDIHERPAEIAAAR